MSQHPSNVYPQPPNIGFQQPPYAPTAMSQPQPVVVAPQLGDSPVRTICPNCRQEIMTRTSTECSVVQHAAFFIMCITGICMICSCLPYCMDSLGKVRHECPNCHAHIGTYSK